MSQQQVTTTAASSAAQRPAGMSWLIRCLIVLAVGGGGAIMLFLWVAIFGAVVGVEFSPERFERRTFVYYQVPGLGIQVRPIVRESKRNGLEQFLLNKNYVQETASADKARWDLVHDNQHRADAAACDAGILCGYLDTYGPKGGFLWKNWSDDHRDQAKLLWPAVAELARAEMYVLIPDLFDVVGKTEKAAEFKALLRETLADSYCRMARVEQRRGRHERAVELFTSALKHDGAHVDSLRGRAESLRKLGQNDKAAADLAEAKELDNKRT